jgi:small conductance mechanosensitive channel
MEVLINLISDNSDLIIHFVLQGMLAIAILIIGVKVANFFAKLTEITFEKKKIDKTVAGFISNIIHALVFAATVLMALSQVGIETTSFVAILGAAGLAVGLALQGSLSNFASGVLIIVLRPFKSGDYIEAGGQAGSVERIEIFATELRTS